MLVAASCSSPPTPPDGSTTTTTEATTTTTTVPTTTPPQGITLTEPDGGKDYFAQWPNSFPSDPSYFPIGVWAETIDDFSPRYADLGVNVFVNPYTSNGPGLTQTQANEARANGITVIPYVRDNTFTDPAIQDVIKARTFGDEYDLGSPTKCDYGQAWLASVCNFIPGTNVVSGDSVQAMANAVRDKDSTRPVYGQFTGPLVFGSGAGASQEERVKWANSTDILSFDYYPLTNYHEHFRRNYGQDQVTGERRGGEVWWQAEAVYNARELAGYDTPVWVHIETSQVFPHATNNSSYSKDYRPTPDEVESQVWNAIVAGARGVQYFNHDFNCMETDPCSSHVLMDAPWADISERVGQVNAKIHELAPVINSDYADGVVSLASGEVNFMVKYYNDDFYLFVTPKASGSQEVQFDLRSDYGVEPVYGTSYSSSSTSSIVDTFESETSTHIYKLQESGETTTTIPATTTTTIPATTSTTTTTTPDPPSTDFPTFESTGPDPSVALTPSGSINVYEDGAVIEGLDVRGSITVYANDVVIRDVKVSGSNPWAIRMQRGYSNMTMERVEIVGEFVEGEYPGTWVSAAIYGEGGWTLRDSRISGYPDGATLHSNTVVEGNYFFGNVRTADSQGRLAHVDGLQASGGRNVVIRNNTFDSDFRGGHEMGANLMIQNEFAQIADYLIEDNLFSGGNYTLYFNDKKRGHPPHSNVLVRNNTFVRDSWQYGPLYPGWSGSGMDVSFEGNVFADGSNPSSLNP